MAEPTISILSNVVCELGEGPSYDPATGKLFWIDITGRKLLEQRYPDGNTLVHDLPVMTSAIAVIDGDRQLLVTELGLQIRDSRSGELSSHLPLEADNAGTRSNDSRVHPSGAFWIGTMGKKAELKAGSIYWYRKGEIRKLFPEAHIPNSISFSPDGATAYFTGLELNVLMRVACDPATGLPTGEPRIFADRRTSGGELDGSVVDADGVLWNAVWDGARVDAYAPDGSHIRTIGLPASRTTCPAFVGPDASRMAVTSASIGLDEEALEQDPHAGKTFLIDMPVRGRFEPSVAL